MVDLVNVQGGSLVPDVLGGFEQIQNIFNRQRALDIGERGVGVQEAAVGLDQAQFLQGLRNQQAVQAGAQNVFNPKLSQGQRDKSLAAVTAVNPPLGRNLNEILKRGDAREIKQTEEQMRSDRATAQFIKAGKTHSDKIARIRSVMQDKFNKGENTDELQRLSGIQSEDRLNLALDKLDFLAKTGKELATPAGGQFEPITDPQTGKIIGQRNVATGKVVSDPRTPKAPTPELSGERFEQEKEIAATKAKADIDKAIQVHKETQAFDAKTPAGQLKQKILEGKAAQVEIDKNKRLMRQEAKDAKAKLLEGKVDEALVLVDKWFTTGFMGQMLNAIGGTDARNLRSVIDTIQANLGFAELQAMRDASPTGGALGQVAVRELDLLQATVASLDQGLDDETLINNLEQVRTHIQNWKSAVDQSNQAAPDQEQTGKEIFDKAQEDLKNLSNEDLLKRF